MQYACIEDEGNIGLLTKLNWNQTTDHMQARLISTRASRCYGKKSKLGHFKLFMVFLSLLWQRYEVSGIQWFITTRQQNFFTKCIQAQRASTLCALHDTYGSESDTIWTEILLGQTTKKKLFNILTTISSHSYTITIWFCALTGQQVCNIYKECITTHKYLNQHPQRTNSYPVTFSHWSARVHVTCTVFLEE